MPQSYGFIFKPARDFMEKFQKMFYGCTQAHEEEYSSGSVSKLKWFNQATQVVQSASSDVSVSLRSHIRNPMQPYS